MSEKQKLEKELKALYTIDAHNFGKTIFHLKRSFDHWSLQHLSKEGFPDIKIGYLPFLFNIELDGITNNELSNRLNVTKQAMSKTLKELERLDLIEFKKKPSDARSSLIYLTIRGMKMVINTRKRVTKLTDTYIETIGKKKYYSMMDSLLKLIDIHATLDK